jgi:hypothetical protein
MFLLTALGPKCMTDTCRLPIRLPSQIMLVAARKKNLGTRWELTNLFESLQSVQIPRFIIEEDLAITAWKLWGQKLKVAD